MAGDASPLLDELDPVKRLALSYAPRQSREATLALLALDERLARMLRGRREPIAVQLRLAWWRDRLREPSTNWPRGDPVLDTLRGWDDAAPLAALVDGWEALLAEELTPAAIEEFAEGRARGFAALAQELGSGADAASAARLWALADLAAHLSDSAERATAVESARGLSPPRLPAALRPLAVLAGLGARALGRGGGPLLAGPGAAFLALRIGLTGR